MWAVGQLNLIKNPSAISSAKKAEVDYPSNHITSNFFVLFQIAIPVICALAVFFRKYSYHKYINEMILQSARRKSNKNSY